MRTAFLCHHQQWDKEVHELADELRLRGVTPWVDVHGGFQIGDHTPTAVRRAIIEESFATLVYATPGIFDRPFVRDEEIPAALATWEADPRYLLSVIARAQGYGEIREASLASVKHDLTPFTGRKASGNVQERQLCFELIGRELLDQYLERFGPKHPETVQFQFSTRDLLGDEPDDLFRIDATHILTDAASSDQWRRVERGLRDVKAVIARRFGRPRIMVHGSKYLSAAFLLGAAFPSTTAPISIRTKKGYWSTDEPAVSFALERHQTVGPAMTGNLFLELDVLGHSTSSPVDEYTTRTKTIPQVRVRLTPSSSPRSPMTNGEAVSVADQIRGVIQIIQQEQSGIKQVFLFASLPQALAVFIGHRSNALPPIQLHEFVNGAYQPSLYLNAP